MLRNRVSRNCAITGATSGIGKATALELARSGCGLVLVGRDEKRGSKILGQVRKNCPDQQHWFFSADISDLDQVRSLSDSIINICPIIDVLINNAGARFDDYSESKQGLEQTFATNHLGHFLLTGLLLEALGSSASPRIINVSSSAHAGATCPASWSMSANEYDRRQAYARSKLANLLFTYELARRLSGTFITVNAMHPGMVVSGFARNNGLVSWLKHMVSHGLKRELIFPRRGADTLVFLSASEEVAVTSGKYYFRRRPVDSSPLSHDRELAHDLWSKSVDLCELGESLGPAWQFFKK